MTNPTIHLRNSTRPRKVIPDTEMKEYAESAMNELLGWYGYDKMNSGDSHTTSPSVLRSTAKRNSAKLKAFRSSPAPYSTFSPASSFLSTSSSSSSLSSDDGVEGDNITDACASNKTNDSILTAMGSSARESSENSGCGWCLKANNEAEPFTVKMINSDKVFCSEICFNHYRRANFRRNKTCDWCRHVRHTVDYVNLRDGDNRYQFCSNKCLNQFKLDIFCQETKEHLELHPHHREQMPTIENNSSVVLITPDLWLKNCVSPCNSDKSRSSSPTGINSSASFASIQNSRRKSTRAVSPPEESPAEETVVECSTRKRKTPKLRSSLATPSPRPHSTNNLTKSTTPKISFKPNFSSMLPSSTAASALVDANSSRLRGFQSSSASSNDRDCSSTTTLPVPPLLPITKSQPAPGFASLPTPVISQPTYAPSAAKGSSISASTTISSLVPPPTVLIPYPIILPIPLPIPIPIPLPISIPIPFEPAARSGDDQSEQNRNIDADNDRPRTVNTETGGNGSDNRARSNCTDNQNDNELDAGGNDQIDSINGTVMSKRYGNVECKLEIRPNSLPATCIEESRRKRRKLNK